MIMIKRDGKMKVAAFNCSPKMDKGNTALILTPFHEGMRGAGAEVDLFYVRELKINPCNGEFNCWTKNPGRCYQEDDMNRLYPKLQGADIWVFATPVYVDGVSGPMKNLMDRMIPLVQPFFELRDGRCRHPLREGTKGGKVVLVSTSGFWEMDNFDPLLIHMKAFCKNASREFAGALLRPHGGGLRRMIEIGIRLDDILTAAREAGRQLVKEGKMAPEILETVSRQLIPREVYIQATNALFQEALEAKETVRF